MSEPESASEVLPAGLSPSGRLEAFSDGVLAVAITLLVLDLRVPDVVGSLWSELTSSAMLSGFAAYVTSFLVIGIMWANHHALFRRIALVDRRLMIVNLVLLLFIGLLPFATALAARYVARPGWNGRVALAVYSGVVLLVAMTFSGLWAYALRHPRLLEPSVDVEAARRAFPRFSAGVLGYAALVGISFVSAPATLLLHFALAVYYAFDALG